MNDKEKAIQEFKKELALYSSDLESVLNSCDSNKFFEFVEKWYNKGLIDKKTYETYKNSDDTTKINSYCVLILGSKKTSEEAKEWAKNNKVDAKC